MSAFAVAASAEPLLSQSGVGVARARPHALPRFHIKTARCSKATFGTRGRGALVVRAVAAKPSESALKSETIANDNKYLLQNYGPRVPVVFTHGEGCLLFDSEGKEYLDFASGIAVNILGHSDAEWAAAVADQAAKLCHVSNLYHTQPGADLAKRLCEASFADRAFFCNSGTEANEGAMKFARRLARQRAEEAGEEPATGFVAFTRCFHGRTFGALSLTSNPKYKEQFAPLLEDVKFAEYGNLKAAEVAIKKGQTAAVFIEPVQGEGGVWPAQIEFLQGLREICDREGAVLVFDEVQCGLGRTGKLFGHDHFGVTPDMMTLAKPLAAGMPIGAVLMTEEVAAAIKPGDHGSTFAGNPLVARAAHVVMDRLDQPGFLANVEARGVQLRAGLSSQLKGNPNFVEVRGMGLLVGVQLTVPAGPVVGAARDAGLLVLTAGAGDVVRILPPLIATEAEIDKAITILVKAINTAL